MSATELIDSIKTRHEKQAAEAETKRRHQELLQGTKQTQTAILAAIHSLIRYLEGSTTKAEIVNQLESVGTPDALKVAEAVNELHDTIRGQEPADFSPLVAVMEQVYTELQKIPKEQPTIDIPTAMSVTNMVDHTKDFQALTKAVKAIKMVAEAPNITVDPPKVEVNMELAPLIDKMTEQIKATKAGQAKVVEGALQTQDVSGLITEKYTSFRVAYADDEFEDSDEPPISKIDYYDGKKRVATLAFRYKNGLLVGVSKT